MRHTTSIRRLVFGGSSSFFDTVTHDYVICLCCGFLLPNIEVQLLRALLKFAVFSLSISTKLLVCQQKTKVQNTSLERHETLTSLIQAIIKFSASSKIDMRKQETLNQALPKSWNTQRCRNPKQVGIAI